MTDLSGVKNGRIFCCLKSAPLCQKSNLRHPNEKSAGLKESGDFLFRQKGGSGV